MSETFFLVQSSMYLIKIIFSTFSYRFSNNSVSQILFKLCVLAKEKEFLSLKGIF